MHIKYISRLPPKATRSRDKLPRTTLDCESSYVSSYRLFSYLQYVLLFYCYFFAYSDCTVHSVRRLRMETRSHSLHLQPLNFVNGALGQHEVWSVHHVTRPYIDHDHVVLVILHRRTRAYLVRVYSDGRHHGHL